MKKEKMPVLFWLCVIIVIVIPGLFELVLTILPWVLLLGVVGGLETLIIAGVVVVITMALVIFAFHSANSGSSSQMRQMPLEDMEDEATLEHQATVWQNGDSAESHSL